MEARPSWDDAIRGAVEFIRGEKRPREEEEEEEEEDESAFSTLPPDEDAFSTLPRDILGTIARYSEEAASKQVVPELPSALVGVTRKVRDGVYAFYEAWKREKSGLLAHLRASPLSIAETRLFLSMRWKLLSALPRHVAREILEKFAYRRDFEFRTAFVYEIHDESGARWRMGVPVSLDRVAYPQPDSFAFTFRITLDSGSENAYLLNDRLYSEPDLNAFARLPPTEGRLILVGWQFGRARGFPLSFRANEERLFERNERRMNLERSSEIFPFRGTFVADDFVSTSEQRDLFRFFEDLRRLADPWTKEARDLHRKFAEARGREIVSVLPGPEPDGSPPPPKAGLLLIEGNLARALTAEAVLGWTVVRLPGGIVAARTREAMALDAAGWAFYGWKFRGATSHYMPGDAVFLSDGMSDDDLENVCMLQSPDISERATAKRVIAL